MDVLFAVQSHPKPPSEPEASSHVHSNSEARVSASRLQRNGQPAMQKRQIRKKRQDVSSSSSHRSMNSAGLQSALTASSALVHPQTSSFILNSFVPAVALVRSPFQT